MIIQMLVDGLKNLIIWFIDLMPDITFDSSLFTSSTMSIFVDIKRIMNYFLSTPIATFLASSFLVWLVLYPILSVLKFIYKKIPGVD